jgi:hypothetical protein
MAEMAGKPASESPVNKLKQDTRIENKNEKVGNNFIIMNGA